MPLVARSHLAQVVAVLSERWPEHVRVLRKRFDGQTEAHLDMAELLAGLVSALVGGDWAVLCDDYRWMCDRYFEEQVHFTRTGAYRLSTFAAAVAEVYSNSEYMRRYMNGLLISQVLWDNHTEALRFYTERFLAGHPAGYDHLEIGPGHGLLLYFAGRDPRAATVEAWDVSQTSLDLTRAALGRLGIGRSVGLGRHDILDIAPDRSWDSVVISEVLEHIEEPGRALATVRRCLRPGGRAFINVPVNAPAPDHITLFRAPEEVVELVAAAGLEPVETGIFPSSGYSEAKARKAKAVISCAIIARNPG